MTHDYGWGEWWRMVAPGLVLLGAIAIREIVNKAARTGGVHIVGSVLLTVVVLAAGASAGNVFMRGEEHEHHCDALFERHREALQSQDSHAAFMTRATGSEDGCEWAMLHDEGASLTERIAAISVPGAILYALLVGLIVVEWWRVFAKAGRPGWAAAVPIYNTYVLVKIAGRPWWWVLLLMVPGLGLPLGIIISTDIAYAFGKETGFGMGLLFLPFVFYGILAWGNDRYLRPSATRSGIPMPPSPPPPPFAAGT